MGSTDKLRLKKEERERIAGARERERETGWISYHEQCVRHLALFMPLENDAEIDTNLAPRTEK
jgi:hypothetical protein